MKLPKELQMRKSKSSIKMENIRITSIIQAFKSEFKKLMNKFNDNRELNFIITEDKIYEKTRIK